MLLERPVAVGVHPEAVAGIAEQTVGVSVHAADGHEICVTVTHVDGLVCARAAFTHSVNYRSAVVFGTARIVTDEAERLAGLRAVTEQLIPGRWEHVRWPTAQELKGTAALALRIEEGSAKIRSGATVISCGARARALRSVSGSTVKFNSQANRASRITRPLRALTDGVRAIQQVIEEWAARPQR